MTSKTCCVSPLWQKGTIILNEGVPLLGATSSSNNLHPWAIGSSLIRVAVIHCATGKICHQPFGLSSMGIAPHLEIPSSAASQSCCECSVGMAQGECVQVGCISLGSPHPAPEGDRITAKGDGVCAQKKH